MAPLPNRRPVSTEEALKNVAHAAMRHGAVLANECQKWCTQVFTSSFPPGNRLAYVFKPATADTVTLALLAFVLLPFFHVPLLPCLVLLITLAHVAATWLAHTHNLSKLGIIDKVGSSLVAQQQLLAKRQASLLQGMEAVTQLQAKIASLEEQSKQVHQLEEQHALLLAQTSRMEAVEKQVAAGQRALVRLPRLQAKLAQLQGKRRLMEKVKWAVQVLKAETAKADSIQDEYSRLKAMRADMQATKLALQAEAQQVHALEVENAKLDQQAARARQLRAQLDALKENVPLQAIDVNISSSTKQGAAMTKADLCRSLDSLPKQQPLSKREPHEYTAARGPTASDSTGPEAPLLSATSLASRLPAPSASVTASVTAGPSWSIGAGGRPQARPTISGRSSCASVGSLQAGRRCMVLETPAGGSNVFQVMDNEAFYTPMVPPDMMTPPGAFTPGPEAAALAAALTSGVPLPAHSRPSISKPLWGGFSREGSAVPVLEEGEEEQDDASFPAAANVGGGFPAAGSVGGFPAASAGSFAATASVGSFPAASSKGLMGSRDTVGAVRSSTGSLWATHPQQSEGSFSLR